MIVTNREEEAVSKEKSEPYFREPNLGPDCSTPRSARLRERRFQMGLEKRTMPEHYARLQEEAKNICENMLKHGAQVVEIIEDD